MEFLQRYCKNNNITAYKLSRTSGVSLTYCYRMLRGEMNNPSISTMNRIAMSFGLKIGDFFREDD
ncbi:helix-turn-helix domain-containing protein [Clostridium vincentii]|uniref:helix-turn-helix domain-containing protein n=1 Tax=Clostridium vincentii TaxID=52704 RepID=UPI003BFA6FC8